MPQGDPGEWKVRLLQWRSTPILSSDWKHIVKMSVAVQRGAETVYEAGRQLPLLTMKFAQRVRSLALRERVGVREGSGASRDFIVWGGSPRPMILRRDSPQTGARESLAKIRRLSRREARPVSSGKSNSPIDEAATPARITRQA